MTAPVAAVAGAAAPAAGAAPPARHAESEHGFSFHDILSALNPLQYLPVIGTIYRAVTGDTIPEPIRRFGSLVVSALLGGPIGIAINLGTMVAEEVTGINLDQTGQSLLHGNSVETAFGGHTDPMPAAQSPVAAGQPPAGGVATAGATDRAADARPGAAPVPVTLILARATPPAEPQAWTPAQLTAYGITQGAAGTLRRAGVEGADVLNGLELSRLHAAHTAYARLAVPFT